LHYKFGMTHVTFSNARYKCLQLAVLSEMEQH